MLTWLKQWWHKDRIDKWLSQAYDPLFATKRYLEHEYSILISTAEFLEDLQKELQSSDNKTDKQTVHERWKALKLDPILEHYRTALLKINEALDNMPDELESRSYTVVFTNDI